MLTRKSIIYTSIFLLLFLFYIVTPLFASFIDYKMVINNSYNTEISIILEKIQIIFEEYFFFVLLIFFYVSIFFVTIKILNLEYKNTKHKNIHINIVLLTLILPCLLLLIRDLSEIYLYVSDQNFKLSVIRDEIYYNFLDRRKTHINILIILTPIIFNSYRKLSIIIYLLILSYSFLSLSRYEIFLIFIIHIILNLKINYKNSLFLILILLLIVLMRNLLSYEFKLNSEYFIILFNQTIIESIHVFISNITAIEYLKNISLTEYFNENFHFLINNLFYTKFDTINISKQTLLYFQNDLNNLQVYSSSGFSTILIYFPIFIFETFFLYYLSYKINDERIFKAQNAFLLLFLFRGHFIQVCLFLVKLSLLLLILLWITKKLQMLNFKVD